MGRQGLTCFFSPCLPALQHQREAPGQLAQIRPEAGVIPLSHTAEQAGPWSVLAYQGPHPPGSEACALRSQRSESVKCANPPCTEFLMAPVDVTSKGHLFQKELVDQIAALAWTASRVILCLGNWGGCCAPLLLYPQEPKSPASYNHCPCSHIGASPGAQRTPGDLPSGSSQARWEPR